jgi:hypothetical protein
MNRAMTGHMENENENIYKGGMGGKILPGMPKKNFAPVKKPKDIFKGGAKADIEKALKG